MHDTTTEAPKRYQCRHIFTDGRRCASPCLRQEEFCYYHHTTRKPVAGPRQRRSRRSAFHLPLPEDRSAIQSSIGEVLQRIASNDIDPRRAGLLLYGLQIASLNLAKTQPVTQTVAEHETIEEITIDPTLGVLAPRAEVSETATHKKPYSRTDRVHNSKRSGRSRLTQPHHPPNPPGHGKYRSIEPCLRPPPNLARARTYLFNSSPFSTRSAITSIPTLSKQSFVDFSSVDCVSYSYRRCYLRRAAISGNTSWSGC
jgi:hypothetical protein